MAGWGGVLVGIAMLGSAGPVHAQVPVCAAPSSSDPYYTACAPMGRLVAARALFDVTVDSVFKPASAQIRRRAGDMLRSLVAEDVLEKNKGFLGYLDALGPLTLAKIDTATGTLQLEVEEKDRRFEGSVELGDAPYPVTIRLPARLSGGYWRTPGVFQIAFWEGQRATVGLGAPGASHVDAEVECLVVSTDGVRVVTAGATPDVLVRFEGCDQ
jgi:hypothetical protein